MYAFFSIHTQYIVNNYTTTIHITAIISTCIAISCQYLVVVVSIGSTYHHFFLLFRRNGCPRGTRRWRGQQMITVITTLCIIIATTVLHAKHILVLLHCLKIGIYNLIYQKIEVFSCIDHHRMLVFCACVIYITQHDDFLKSGCEEHKPIRKKEVCSINQSSNTWNKGYPITFLCLCVNKE